MTLNLTTSGKLSLLYGLILALALFFFSFWNTAHAQTYEIDQYQLSSAVYSTMSDLPVLQTFYPTKPNVAGMFTTIVNTSTSSVEIYYYLCRGIPDINNINTTFNCGNAGNTIMAEGFASDGNPTGTTKDIYFAVTPPFPNYGNFSYYVTLKPIGGNARFVFSPIVGGSWSNYDMRGYGAGIPADYSMYFIEVWDRDSNQNIFLIDPINKTLNNQTLNNFKMAVNIPEVWLFSNWTIRIDYGTSSNNFIYSDKLTLKFNLAGWQELGIVKENNLPSGQYFWRASAYIASDDYGVPYATSTISTFEIDNLADTGNLSIFDRPTENEICDGIATSTFFGAIECGLKKVLTWAFYPSSGTIDDFKDKSDALSKKFPFNTFFDITGGIRLGISSSSKIDSGFSIPFIRGAVGSSDIYMLPVLSSSTLPALIGEQNTSYFRYVQGIFIYILFVLAGYFTATKYFHL